MPLFSPGITVRRLVPAFLLLIAPGSSEAGAPAARKDPKHPKDNVRMSSAAHSFAVRYALRRAAHALGKLECRRVFQDFSDEAGRPLQDRLDALGSSGDAFLASLLFYEGSSHPRCAMKQILAVTRPGSRVVLICTPQFADFAFLKPRFAAAILIHEELHALGLGENPPTSADITARVTMRCAP